MEKEKKEKIKNGFKLGGLIAGLIACVGAIAFLVVSIFVKYPSADNVDNSSSPLVYRNLPKNNPIIENYDYESIVGNSYIFVSGDLDDLSQDIFNLVSDDLNDYVDLTLKCDVDLFMYLSYTNDIQKSDLDVIYFNIFADSGDPISINIYYLNSDNSRTYLYTYGNQTYNFSIKFNNIEYKLGNSFVSFSEFYDYYINSEDINYYFVPLNLYYAFSQCLTDYKNYQFLLDLHKFNPNYFYSKNNEQLGYWSSGLSASAINSNYGTILLGNFVINNKYYTRIRCECTNLTAARIPTYIGTADNSKSIAWVVNQQTTYFTVLNVYADNGLDSTSEFYERVELMYLTSKELVLNGQDISIIDVIGNVNGDIVNVFNYNNYFCYFDAIQVLYLNDGFVNVLAYNGNNARTYYDLLVGMGSYDIIEYNGFGNGNNNVFDLFTLAFNSWIPIFKIDLIPGLAIGTLLFIPFVIGLIIVIFKMVVK